MRERRCSGNGIRTADGTLAGGGIDLRPETAFITLRPSNSKPYENDDK